MLFPIENRIKLVQYALIWSVYALLQSLSLLLLSDLPFGILLVDGVIHALVYAFISLLLWNVILYGNYERMPFLQCVINYGALAVLSLLLWIGVSLGLDYLILGPKTTVQLIPVLPLYAFLGLLIYFVLILYCQNRILKMGLREEEETGPLNMVSIDSTDEAVEEIKNEPEYLERIAVKSGQKIHVILIPEILYIQADGDYVHIFTMNGKYMKEQTMKHFEDHLPDSQFVRVHRSYIVNIESISRIELYEKQSQLLTIKNGNHIKVSAGGYKLLKQKLGL